MTTVHFDDDDLATRLDTLSEAEINQLDFGVIGLDANRVVRFYSATEAAQSGRGDLRALGLSFFDHVAPCMNTPQFKGRIDAAMQAGSMDIEFGHTGDFSDRSRELRVRAMSARDGGVWLAHQRS